MDNVICERDYGSSDNFIQKREIGRQCWQTCIIHNEHLPFKRQNLKCSQPSTVWAIVLFEYVRGFHLLQIIAYCLKSNFIHCNRSNVNSTYLISNLRMLNPHATVMTHFGGNFTFKVFFLDLLDNYYNWYILLFSEYIFPCSQLKNSCEYKPVPLF